MGLSNRRDAALTTRFLRPVEPHLEDLFLGLRAETDQALGRGSPARYGKPYPYGYCLEITQDVMARLRTRLEAPRHPAERALKVYLNSGGEARRVWGVLRDRFFQNALQLGSLYVDVSNDTVDINKPKVEILPLEQSGFETIRDAAHFAGIAERYWGGAFYANTALPSLAPLFPMVGIDAHGQARIYSEGRYMVDLFRNSRFRLSERWLAQAPPPPPAVIEALRAACRPDLLAANPDSSLEAALQACRSARAQGRARDDDWRAARLTEMLAVRTAFIPVPGLSVPARAGARSS